MASLTTVYVLSTVLASAGAMAAGYVANRISTLPAPEPELKDKKKEEVEQSVSESEPKDLFKLIVEKYGNNQTSKDMVNIIQGDEYLLATIGPEKLQEQSSRIWKATLTGDKCQGLCDIIYKKFAIIKKILQNMNRQNLNPPQPPEEVTTLGDQTQSSIEALSPPDSPQD